jgi:hypothetical protein
MVLFRYAIESVVIEEALFNHKADYCILIVRLILITCLTNMIMSEKHD